MQSHVVMPDITQVGESLRRAAESFLHLAKDATTINSNLYGNHGTPKLSLEFIMRGCEFYSSQEDSGGDLAALFILSTFMSVPYLVFRILKDSTISAKNQIATGINDTILLPTDYLNNSETRHSIAQWLGLPGWIAGQVVRLGIYFGGVCGVSSFGYHQVAKTFTNCTNFIFDEYASTKMHKQYLSFPRQIIPTLLKHFNLAKLVNGMCYGITIICAGLGLTVYSIRMLRRTLNQVSQFCYQRDIFTITEREKNAYDHTRTYSVKWFAHFGAIGLVGIGIGSVPIILYKFLHRGLYLLKDAIDLSRRILGFSSYSAYTIARAYINCFNFIVGGKLELTSHQTFIDNHQQYVSLNHFADRSWIGFNRLLNGFGYGVTFICGVLGLTIHSMIRMKLALNSVNEYLYQRKLFELTGNHEIQKHSKEWFAQFGLLGLAGIVVGSSCIIIERFLSDAIRLTCKLLGFSWYGFHTVVKSTLLSVNFIVGTTFSIEESDGYLNRHKADTEQSIFKLAERSWIGVNRIINGFNYALGLMCAITGLTIHSFRFLRDSLNYANHLVNQKVMFNVNKNENTPVRFSKEWFASFGLVGVIGSVIGSSSIILFSGIKNLLDLTRRIMGFSEYAIYTIGKAYTLCLNFIFDTKANIQLEQNFIDKHKANPNQTIFKRADRSWVGINRIFNGLAYFATTCLGVLGFTAHSMQMMYRIINMVSRLLYQKDFFHISEQEQNAYNQHRIFSNEWFARFGLFGMTISVVGSALIALTKSFHLIKNLLDLTRRMLGLSLYALNTVTRSHIYCINFIYGEQLNPKINLDYIAEHKAKSQTIFTIADRSWVGLNRFINGFQYSFALFCGITGLTVHATQARQRALNMVNRFFYQKDLYSINPKEKERYDQQQLLSKEWFARFGIVTFIGVGLGSTLILTKRLGEELIKGIDVLRRVAGFSTYGFHTLAKSYKNCSNFILGTQFDVNADQLYIDHHKANCQQSIYTKADRSWLGLNRIINGFNYLIALICGVTGFNIYGFRSLRKELNYIYNLFYDRNLFNISDEERAKYNSAKPYSKEWFARGGLLVLGATGIALITIPTLKLITEACHYLIKSLDFSRRMAGFTMYSLHTMARALKNSLNFVCGTQFKVDTHQLYIDKHKAKENQDWFDWSDRTWIGVNRILNGFSYCVSIFCGVTGFTIYSLRAMRRFINGVANFTYSRDIFSVSIAEQEAYEDTNRFSKEWFSRGGMLGVAGMIIGTSIIFSIKLIDKTFTLLKEILDLTCRSLGFSLYGAHSTVYALKNCANYVFGTNFEVNSHLDYINQHFAKSNQTIYDKAERNWLGLHRMIAGFAYGVSGVLGIVGLTATNVHRAIRAFKRVHNLVSAEDQQKSMIAQDNFLQKMETQNRFTRFTSNWNVLYPASYVCVHLIWAVASITTFCIRASWKLTLGNFFSFSSACGNDGVLQIISRHCVNDSAIDIIEDKSNPTALRLLYREDNPIKKMQHHFYDLLWALEPSGDLPERKEGESMSYEQAVVHSKKMGVLESISWRFAYEIRKSVSLFSLDSIPEKVILHFASTFKRYIKEARIKGEFDANNIVHTFFGSEYTLAVKHVEKQYNKAVDKEAVRAVAEAIKNDVIQTMSNNKKYMNIK